MSPIIVEVPQPRSSFLATWGPVIGPSITAVIALIGVAVSVLIARQTFKEEQAENRRDRQRELIAKLVAAASQETPLRQTNALAFSKMASTDLFEYAQTDSVARLSEMVKERSAALIHARMEVGDPVLRTAVNNLHDAFEKALNDPSAGTVVDMDANSDKRFGAALTQLGLIKKIDDRIVELQNAAIAALPVGFAAKSAKGQ